MVKRLMTSVALAFGLVAAPSGGHAQVSASVSLHLGLFDGVGMGLAVSNWRAASIYSPGFHVGFGASVGFGGNSYAPSGYGYYDDGYYFEDDYYYDDYHYDDYYGHGSWGDPYWRRYHRSYSPLYCRWWGYTNPCWDVYGPFGGFGGFDFSLGMAWNYYRRPVYFDPWWGSVGYYARWRPAWAFDPGWYYYNDPYWATPGYARVAYVLPARGYIYTSAPHAGYRSTSFKETASRVASTPRQAQPRGNSASAGTGVTRQSPAGDGRTVAQPGTQGPRNGGAVRQGTPGTETARTAPGSARGAAGTPRVATPSTRVGGGTPGVATPSTRVGGGTPRVTTPSTRVGGGTPRVATPSARVGNGTSRAATPSRGSAATGGARPTAPRAVTPSVNNPQRPTDGIRSGAGAQRVPAARTPSGSSRGTPQVSPGSQGTARSAPGRTPSARVPSGTPTARSAPNRTPAARAPSGTPTTRSAPSNAPNARSAPSRTPVVRTPTRGGSGGSPAARAPSAGSRSAPSPGSRVTAPKGSAPTARSAPTRSAPTRSAPTRSSPPKVRRPGGGGS